MFKYVLLNFILFLGFNSTTFGNDSTLLWKISGNNLQQPSYVFGTFHLLCNNDWQLTPSIKEAVSSSKQLFLEIDISNKNALNKEIMQLIVMKNGHTLSEFISKNELERADSIFKQKTGMPLMLVQHYKPFMLTSLLYPSMLQCTSISVETELMKLAATNNIGVSGLETIAFQMGIFDQIPYEIQAKMLMKALLKFDEGKNDFKKMVKLYKEGNIEKLASSITKDEEFGQFESQLLSARNKNWIPQIEEAIKNKTCFFAVGAGHLGGKTGVIQLLQNAGYTVSPVY